MPPPPSPDTTLEPLWTQHLQSPIVGLSLARESETLLAWDHSNWLYHFNQAGQRQAQVRFPTPIQAAISNDGSAIAVVSAEGLFWLEPDLSTRHRQALPTPIAVALDSFGQYVAVADSRNQVNVFDRVGRRVTQVALPRSFHHLAFAATAPLIVGVADYGFVGCVNLQGELLWRHGLVSHVGNIDVVGTAVLLACFSEGVQRYDLTGKDLGRIKSPDSCRLLSASFDGQFILIAGRTESISLLDAAGTSHGVYPAAQSATAVATSALGDYALVADAAGAIVKLAIRPKL